MQTKPTIFRTLLIAVMLLGTVFVLRATATASRPPAQPTAIAIVDILNVFAGLEEREVLEAQLNDRVDSRKAQLDEIVEDLKNIDADVQMLTPGTDAHREKVQEGREKQAVLKARQEVLSQIVSIDMGSVRRSLFVKVEAAIAQIAEREGYDIVLFDDSSFPIPEVNASDADVYRAIITKSVMYRHESIDITDQVITLMNNEFSAP